MAKRTKRVLVDHVSTIGGVVSDAFATIEELGSEMRDAYDNTPESLQNGGVGEARGQAADDLEAISEADVPETFQETEVKWQSMPLKRRASRADRLSDALEGARAALEVLDEIRNDEKRSEDEREKADQCHSDIESMIDEAEAVTFPGMYG